MRTTIQGRVGYICSVGDGGSAKNIYRSCFSQDARLNEGLVC